MKKPQNEPTQQTVDAVAHDLGLVTPNGIRFLRIVLSLAVLFDRKQQDYGPGNLADFEEHGVLVRISDKIGRLKNLIGRVSPVAPNFESVSDSWRDTAVYGVIGLMFRTGIYSTEPLPKADPLPETFDRFESVPCACGGPVGVVDGEDGSFEGVCLRCGFRAARKFGDGAVVVEENEGIPLEEQKCHYCKRDVPLGISVCDSCAESARIMLGDPSPI